MADPVQQDPNSQALSPEDAQALIHAQQQLYAAGDPRATKLYNYIVQGGYAAPDAKGQLQPKGSTLGQFVRGNDSGEQAVDRASQLEPMDYSSVGGFVKTALENLGAGATQATLGAINHPLRTFGGIGETVAAAMGGPGNPAQQDLAQKIVTPFVQNPGGAAFAAVPQAALALAGAPEAEEATGSLFERGKAAFNAAQEKARGAIAGDVNAPIAGTDVTPAARYAAMQRVGVQPSAAEATNSTPLNIAEKVNQNSLTAAPTYAAARARNLDALNDYTHSLLDKMGPEDAEAGGAVVQKGLRYAQEDLQNQAAQGFKALDEATDGRMLQGKTLQQTAQRIYDANADYYKAHPDLVPTNAWNIVKDLAGAPEKTRSLTPVQQMQNDLSGSAAGSRSVPFQSRPMSFSEVHQLRSDLLEMVRANPDIVKNQATGWIQQLANAADQTMTQGAGALNPEGTQIYRAANQAWADMKATYDNPSHPFYSAVRTPSPSTLVKGIQRTPEAAGQLVKALGRDGIGPIQRGVAEDLLGTTKEGNYNFGNFQGRLNKLPQGYAERLFSPDQLQHLRDIADTGTVLNADANPSGSARLGQGIAEGAEGLRSVTNLHELAGNAVYHAGQYGLSKVMNYPGFVDWLMKGRGFAPVGDAMPGTGASPAALAPMAGALPIDRTGPQGQPNYYSEEHARARAAFNAARQTQ